MAPWTVLWLKRESSLSLVPSSLWLHPPSARHKPHSQFTKRPRASSHASSNKGSAELQLKAFPLDAHGMRTCLDSVHSLSKATLPLMRGRSRCIALKCRSPPSQVPCNMPPSRSTLSCADAVGLASTHTTSPTQMRPKLPRLASGPQTQIHATTAKKGGTKTLGREVDAQSFPDCSRPKAEVAPGEAVADE